MPMDKIQTFSSKYEYALTDLFVPELSGEHAKPILDDGQTGGIGEA
ncbi:25198_t:CDS:2, partial [Dentiscutata erythropus]